MATKKPGGAPAAPPQGNEFTYYVPKPAAPAAPSSVISAVGPVIAVTPTKPIPTLTVPVGGGKGVYLNPKDFIETNFIETPNANFGTKATLGGAHHVIRKVDVVRAAIEGGYGRRSDWSSALVLNKTEAGDLARYLIQRLQLLAACLDVNANNAQLLRSFYKRIEASEKTALSFIVGGIGAYLAAQKWLAAGGDNIRSFLHVGIFTKGATAPVAMALASASKKVPDYLVEGVSGDWHVFESKGGHINGRWERICQGLTQLAHVPKIGWAGKAANSAVTCVCVHTSVDPGKVLRVTAVDPPPEEAGAEGEQPFVLIEGVCRLLQMLETIEQFRALANPSQGVGAPILEISWLQARSSLFGGLSVGIPVRYVKREDEVRQRLAVFFAIREVLEDWKNLANAEDYFVGSVMVHVTKAAPSDFPVNGWTFEVPEVLKELAPQVRAADFLFLCSKALLLEDLAAQLMPVPSQDIERLLLYLGQTKEFVITSGGMFIQAAAEVGPNVEG